MDFDLLGLDAYPAIHRVLKPVSNSYSFLDFPIPGLGNKTSDKCNQPVLLEYCPDCGDYEIRSRHCNNWTCPVCYSFTAGRSGHAVADRLWGIRKDCLANGLNPGSLNHLDISLPVSEYGNFDFKKERERAKRYLKQIGMVGGVLVFHPWRMYDEIQEIIVFVNNAENVTRGRYWKSFHEGLLERGGWRWNSHLIESGQDYVEFSPHFHAVGFFRIKERSDSFYERTGWTYTNITMKNHRRPLDCKAISGTVSYLCTHHYINPGGLSVTYFGIAASCMSNKEKLTEVVRSKCKVCYRKLSIRDLENNEIGVHEKGLLVKIHVTDKKGCCTRFVGFGAVKEMIKAYCLDEILEKFENRTFKLSKYEFTASFLTVVHTKYKIKYERVKKMIGGN